MSLLSFLRFLMILGPIFDHFCVFCLSSVCNSSGPVCCVLSGDVIFDRFLMVFGRFLMVFRENEKMVFVVLQVFCNMVISIFEIYDPCCVVSILS